MNRNGKPEQFFAIKITSTRALPDDAFKALTERYAALSESGLPSRCFKDRDPKGPPFWQTFGHDYSEKDMAESMRWLRHFMGLYFRDNRGVTLSLDQCVEFKTILSEK